MRFRLHSNRLLYVEYENEKGVLLSVILIYDSKLKQENKTKQNKKSREEKRKKLKVKPN